MKMGMDVAPESYERFTSYGESSALPENDVIMVQYLEGQQTIALKMISQVWFGFYVVFTMSLCAL